MVVYRSDLLQQLFTPEEPRRTREALLEVLFLLALTASEMEKLNGKVALITGNNLSSICLMYSKLWLSTWSWIAEPDFFGPPA